MIIVSNDVDNSDPEHTITSWGRDSTQSMFFVDLYDRRKESSCRAVTERRVSVEICDDHS